MARFKTVTDNNNAFQMGEERPLGGSGAYNFEQSLNEYDEFEAQEFAEADQT